jgi:hypothetical protein
MLGSATFTIAISTSSISMPKYTVSSVHHYVPQLNLRSVH